MNSVNLHKIDELARQKNPLVLCNLQNQPLDEGRQYLEIFSLDFVRLLQPKKNNKFKMELMVNTPNQPTVKSIGENTINDFNTLKGNETYAGKHLNNFYRIE